MIDDNATPLALEMLLDAVENVINDASKIAVLSEAGMMDGASVPAHRIKELSDAYDHYVHPEMFEDD